MTGRGTTRGAKERGSSSGISKAGRSVPVRANYEPTWRVKGNPICITRRAGYRATRLRYLHYTRMPPFFFLSASFFPWILP